MAGRSGSGVGGCWLGRTYPKFGGAVMCVFGRKLFDRRGSMPVTAAFSDVVSLLEDVSENLAYDHSGMRSRLLVVVCLGCHRWLFSLFFGQLVFGLIFLINQSTLYFSFHILMKSAGLLACS